MLLIFRGYWTPALFNCAHWFNTEATLLPFKEQECEAKLYSCLHLRVNLHTPWEGFSWRCWQLALWAAWPPYHHQSQSSSGQLASNGNLSSVKGGGRLWAMVQFSWKFFWRCFQIQCHHLLCYELRIIIVTCALRLDRLIWDFHGL